MSNDIDRLTQSILQGMARLQSRPPVLPGAAEQLADIDANVWAMVELEEAPDEESQHE